MEEICRTCRHYAPSTSIIDGVEINDPFKGGYCIEMHIRVCPNQKCRQYEIRSTLKKVRV